MAFTDADLKRLKDFVSGDEAIWPNMEKDKLQIRRKFMNSLLARFEAAEKVIARALKYKHHFHMEGCTCDNCLVVNVWREVAGK